MVAPDTHRLFFALCPPADTRDRLVSSAASIDSEPAPGGRAARPDRYHVTLQFLGDHSPWPQALHERACDAAARVAVPAFDLTMDRAGAFPEARVWWLGCSRVPPELLSLWTRLGEALAEAEVPVRAYPVFTPHLTIRRGVAHGPAATAVAPVTWRVDAFVLLDSRPGKGYVETARWPLPDDCG